MIADMGSNKKLSVLVTELCLRGRKLNNSLTFILQSYLKVPKTIRLNARHYFIIKISKKRKLQKITLNHSSEIELKDFIKLYNDYSEESYSFLVNDTTLPSDNPLKLIYEKLIIK